MPPPHRRQSGAEAARSSGSGPLGCSEGEELRALPLELPALQQVPRVFFFFRWDKCANLRAVYELGPGDASRHHLVYQ